MFRFFSLSPGNCINEQSGQKYKVGETFLKHGKCCRCEEGGTENCSNVEEECQQGNVQSSVCSHCQTGRGWRWRG